MRHTVLIDSRDREYDAYPDPSEYRVMLPMIYKHVVAARLVSAEIPSSFYVFSADANNTTLSITLDGESSPRLLTIPDGNYSVSTMTSTLSEILTIATGIPFTATVSQTTLCLTIENEGGVDFTIDTLNALDIPTGWGLPFYLGFDKDRVYASTNGSLTAPRLISLNPHNYILLDIEELNGLHESGMYKSFAKIPFDAYSFEYVFLDIGRTTFPEVVQRPPLTTLDRLRIRFRFHDGRLVDFRGVEHSLAIELITKDLETTRPQTPDTMVAHAASTAAAAAAAAAITATKTSSFTTPAQRKAKAKSKTAPPPPALLSKTQWRYGLYALIVCVIAWFVYMKRTPTPSVQPAIR